VRVPAKEAPPDRSGTFLVSDLRVLGVVPARGGSKGVPRKNIRLLGGRPLLVHTIETALLTRAVDPVVVSTEDPAIAEVARKAGVQVIDRPASLATDVTPSAPVIEHATLAVEAQLSTRFDAVMTLQPTAPFRSTEDIERAVELLWTSGAESVISVVRVLDQHPARAKRIVDGRLEGFFVPEEESARRQDLEPAYLRNGAIYLTRRDVLDKGTLRGTHQQALVMPPERSVNIDEELDFLTAEAVLANRSGQ
jgi:CMP-N,N'-diacetyllegionaminic acid synthase